MIFAALLLELVSTPASPSNPVPRGPLPSLVSIDDYPVAAIRAGQSGTVGFRLDIATDGRVRGCTILTSSGSAVLDSTTCRLMTSRARFTPARDATGQATTGSYASRIAWKLGPPSPPRLDAATALWQSCVVGEVAKSVTTTLEPTAVTAASFTTCAGLEALLLSELARANVSEQVPATELARLKQQTGTRLAEQLRTTRTLLEVGNASK